MHIKFYGTRGSIPVCEKDFTEFGGNTTCLSLHIPEVGRVAIIDGGTGIRKVGRELIQKPPQNPLIIGFTHFHMDHIQGFPFFAPAYNPEQQITMMLLGGSGDDSELRSIFSNQMKTEYFPVPLEKMGAQFSFVNSPNYYFEYMGTMVKAQKHVHPGGCYGMRISRENQTIVIRTDIEYPNGIQDEDIEFCKDADLLIHDAQFTDQELLERPGWGHSSYNQAMELAEKANVKTVVMTHHDPDHDDFFLEAQEKECQKRFANCVFAREGQEYFCD